MAALNMSKTNLTLAHCFYHCAMQFPKNIAIQLGDEHYTYSNLLRNVHSLATFLNSIDHSCIRCAVYSDRNYSAYLSILAILFAGKAYVPINPSEINNRKKQRTIELSQPGVICIDAKNLMGVSKLLETLIPTKVCLFCQEHFEHLSEKIPHHQYYLWNQKMRPSHAIEGLLADVLPTNEAYVMFTSGSTGDPKGIVVKHYNVISYIDAMTRLYQPKPNDRFSQLVELTFDLSVHDLFLCWSNGASLYVMPEDYIFGIKNFMRKNAITFWISVPSTITLLNQIGHLEKNNFPALRQSFFCGEALSITQARLWQVAASNSEIHNIYGPTEATVAFTYFKFRQKDFYDKDGIVPIGQPLGSGRVAIVNKDGELCNPGEIGELCLSGQQVVSGYLNNQQATQNQFVYFSWDERKTCWYKTGDLAIQNVENQLEYKGRIDDQWQIRGYRIERLEIENELKRIAKSEAIAISPLLDGVDNVIGFIAFVVEDLDEKQLIKDLRLYLPRIMLPNCIVKLKAIPKNMNGKTDYTALKKIVNERDFAQRRSDDQRKNVGLLPST